MALNGVVRHEHAPVPARAAMRAPMWTAIPVTLAGELALAGVEAG